MNSFVWIITNRASGEVVRVVRGDISPEGMALLDTVIFNLHGCWNGCQLEEKNIVYFRPAISKALENSGILPGEGSTYFACANPGRSEQVKMSGYSITPYRVING